MDKQTHKIGPKHRFLYHEVEGFDLLAELALDMHWSWNHFADEVWRQLDPMLWELTHNPWAVLQTASRQRIEQVLADPAYHEKIRALVQVRRQVIEAPAWFQEHYPQSPVTAVAYFSMEYMLSEALPIYSGGLGNVAGDHLKAASDLGVPIIGIGLLYQQGYFRQVIDNDGVQQALYPYNDPGQLPITPLREANGEWLRLEVELPGYSVWLRAWQAQVGRVKLYLLDSNDVANFPVHRGITGELYGGGTEVRLKQELVLGIGGWRLLTALGIQPEICHLNEGHTAFAVLERVHTCMQVTGQPFSVALAAVRAGTIFTTHTAVAAGFDCFSPALIEHYLGEYAEQKLRISKSDLLALGRQNPSDQAEPFNMAYLAVRGSCGINGVSRLHGQVSRKIFQPIFPRWPESEVPVEYVTNGVHTPSWDSAEADELWTQVCGKPRWRGATEALEQDMRCVSDEQLWQLRTNARAALVDYARRRLLRQLAVAGATAEDVENVKNIFDPNTLTLAFARRFATYKRPNLLLQDPERLLRLLTNERRPVQLIIAGKAHPEDKAGQLLIEEWIRFIRQSGARQHVVFLSDYDMLLTEHLVQGADVWINTPRRPWEACGTSGMKVLVNGGLNLSERDGWWAEAYTPEVGWALGDGREHDNEPAWDGAEAVALYELLEREVIPEFYERDDRGIATAWVARIHESMARLTPQFSANRMAREYTEHYYLPCAVAYRKRIADDCARAKQIADWRRELAQKWSAVRFGGIKIVSSDTRHLFEVHVYLNEITPEAVSVELYAEALNGGKAVRKTMNLLRPLAEAPGGYVYSAEVSAARRAAEYTARVIPHFSGVAVPLETSQILWQR